MVKVKIFKFGTCFQKKKSNFSKTVITYNKHKKTCPIKMGHAAAIMTQQMTIKLCAAEIMTDEAAIMTQQMTIKLGAEEIMTFQTFIMMQQMTIKLGAAEIMTDEAAIMAEHIIIKTQAEGIMTTKMAFIAHLSPILCTLWAFWRFITKIWKIKSSIRLYR